MNRSVNPKGLLVTIVSVGVAVAITLLVASPSVAGRSCVSKTLRVSGAAQAFPSPANAVVSAVANAFAAHEYCRRS